MVLLAALVALAAGCGGGGGDGAPAAHADSGQSQGQPDSSEPPGTTDSGEPPGAGDGAGSGVVDLRISGAPPGEVLTETPFSFTPTVHNPGGHALSFSAVNLPRWATLDASTGEISGTPAASDVGSYTGIQVTVTGGGESRTSLPYAIQVVDVAPGSVTLNWSPPTQNADGTPLTDLAGFRIRYGLSPDALTRSVTIDNAGATSVVIENLTVAVWHFGATAYNAEGVESGISNVVSIGIM